MLYRSEFGSMYAAAADMVRAGRREKYRESSRVRRGANKSRSKASGTASNETELPILDRVEAESDEGTPSPGELLCVCSQFVVRFEFFQAQKLTPAPTSTFRCRWCC